MAMLAPHPHQQGEGGSAVGTPPDETTSPLLVDRERVAEHITNTLVHEMFQVSLDLHSALTRVYDDHADTKIREAIQRLDHAINHVYFTVFEAPTEARTPSAERERQT